MVKKIINGLKSPALNRVELTVDAKVLLLIFIRLEKPTKEANGC